MDHVEVLMKLSETHRAAEAKRHSHKWKILVLVLSFYVLCVSAKLTTELKNVHISGKLVWPIFLVLALATIVYLWNLSKSNQTNLRYAHLCEDKILETKFRAKHNSFVNEYKKISGSYTKLHLSFINKVWQIVIVLVFSSVSAWLITG